MKSEPLEAEIRDAELGDRPPAALDLVDTYIANVGQFTGLYVEVAVGQAGRLFHLGK